MTEWHWHGYMKQIGIEIQNNPRALIASDKVWLFDNDDAAVAREV